MTGWDQPLSQCLPRDEVDELASRLEASFDDPYQILTRAHILKVERSVVEESRRDFARILAIQPSVAALAYARLIEHITEIAVRQRHATPETAEWIAPSDLDALASRIVEAVDVESLDGAIRAGIIEGSPVERMDRVHGAGEAGLDYRHVIGSLVRKPGAFARYRYREQMFPTGTFRLAYDALREWRGERADVDYVRILHLAATTMESEVDRALGLLLEAGTPFDYAAVRELAAPAPPQVPELALPRVVDLRVYDRLLAAGVR